MTALNEGMCPGIDIDVIQIDEKFEEYGTVIVVMVDMCAVDALVYRIEP